MFLPVAQQPSFGLGRLAVEVSRSHTHTRAHPIELLRMSDQLVPDSYLRCTQQTKETNMRAVGDIRTHDSSSPPP